VENDVMKPTQFIETKEELEKVLGTPSETQVNKCIDHIDQHCRIWIERTPFIVISSINRTGMMDVSPKGDPAGFVKVLDEKTLAIPDRLGNRRGDTFLNVLERSSCAIIFIIPLRREVVRVSGDAKIAYDPKLLQSMAINDKIPDLALVVTVREAMFHCGKSIIRSNLWNPDAWDSIDGLPTYAQALRSHAKSSQSEDELQAIVTNNEEKRLY
jgi:PPOX class probable FMN-dependent enzyme